MQRLLLAAPRLLPALLLLLSAGPSSALRRGPVAAERRQHHRGNLTLPSAGRVAIVLRGQAFRCKKNSSLANVYQNRTACCSAAAPSQQEATASLVQHVIRPLEARGNRVAVVVTDGRCGLTAESILPELAKDAGTQILRFEQRDCKGLYPQNENARFALDTFKAAVPGGAQEIARSYDLVLLLRHDVHWKLPIDEWQEADFSRLNLASRCKESADKRCSNDIMHTMPGHLFPAFDREVGKEACFNVPDPTRCKGMHHCIWDSGHFCRGQLVKHLGQAKVGFVTQWRPLEKVREANEIWELYDVAEE